MINNRPLYGIIGGMGPICSAEFVNYIYSESLSKFQNERNYPRIIMVSDSYAPDRLQSYKEDNFLVLKNYIEDMIQKTNLFNVDKIMICCLVAHACLNKIDRKLIGNIVNIIDLLNNEIGNEEVVLFATQMFYELGFINKKNIKKLEKNDLKELQDFIYKFKTSNNHKIFNDFIIFTEKLLPKYGLNTIALACSDLHRINQFIKKNKLTVSFKIIDAMDLAASYILNDHIGENNFA